MSADLWWVLRRSRVLRAAVSTLGGGVAVGALVGAASILASVSAMTQGEVSNLGGSVVVGAVFGAALGGLVSMGVTAFGVPAHLVALLAHASGRVAGIAICSAAVLGGFMVSWFLVFPLLGWLVAAIASLGALIAAGWFFRGLT